MTVHGNHRKVRRAIREKRHSAPLLKAQLFATARVFGYARVSTPEQRLDVQITALKAAGAEELFIEKISAVSAKRPMFDLLMKIAESGDTILFHSLSRMGREAAKVVNMLQDLTKQGVRWRSLTEQHLDATTPIGRFMITMTGAKDQLERDQVSERTVRGLAERRRQGMWIGRQPKVSPAEARKMVALRRKGMTGEQIARHPLFRKKKIKASTVYARTNELMRAEPKKR